MPHIRALLKSLRNDRDWNPAIKYLLPWCRHVVWFVPWTSSQPCSQKNGNLLGNFSTHAPSLAHSLTLLDAFAAKIFYTRSCAQESCWRAHGHAPPGAVLSLWLCPSYIHIDIYERLPFVRSRASSAKNGTHSNRTTRCQRSRLSVCSFLIHHVSHTNIDNINASTAFNFWMRRASVVS